MSDELRLLRGSASDLSSLEPLWVAVHHQHVESMPQLAPYVDDATTWAHRLELYRELLKKAGTIRLFAEIDGKRVGYGVAHILEPAETWVVDTWVTASRIGEIESISVLPDYRNQGIGTRLLDRLEHELADAGVSDLILGVLPDNAAAIRMYERRGFNPLGSTYPDSRDDPGRSPRDLTRARPHAPRRQGQLALRPAGPGTLVQCTGRCRSTAGAALVPAHVRPGASDHTPSFVAATASRLDQRRFER